MKRISYIEMSKDQIETVLIEHIIKGDRGDGVPNILSPDNVFVVGERQKSINSKKLQAWLEKTPNEFCSTDEMKRGYDRNKMLIDLTSVPQNLKDEILQKYNDTKPATKRKMLEYFIAKQLKHLIEVADEF